MNIIFLDIDGVLRTHKSDSEWSALLGLPIPPIVFDRNFSNKAISNLNEIIHFTGAKVVITSTWRVQHSLEDLKNKFRARGFRGEVIDKTSVLYDRGEEIQEWLDTHDVNKYIVIDDTINDIIRHINPNRVVKCDPSIGLEDYSLVSKIIDILF